MPALSLIEFDAGKKVPPRKDYSVLWDWGSHDVAMAIDISGQTPSNFKCSLERDDTVTEFDAGIWKMSADFPSGARMRGSVSNAYGRGRRWLKVTGDNGSMVYDDLAENKLFMELSDGSGNYIKVDTALPLDVAINDFALSVNGESSCLKGLKLGLDVVRALEAFERALNN